MSAAAGFKQIRRRSADTGADLPGLHPLLARIYRHRGIDSAEQLDLALSRLPKPDALLNAGRAASLLGEHLHRQSRILIVGDFDADGATSTALALGALRELGAEQVDYLVPNRFEYGYGLTRPIVALAAERGAQLIITVDNGISSIDGVAAARERGIATLVTDHHLPGAELPVADVIVNPNQPGCDFPTKALAGVGVIFYVMLALRAELRSRDWFAQRGIEEPNLGRYLDLVALGTVADVVPLDHINRVLVAAGLERMRHGQAREGILALLRVAGRPVHNLVASDLGFSVGPRLNAAGRLDDMSLGIECLLAESPARADQLAAELHQLNLDRRQIEAGMQREALAILATYPDTAEPPVALTLYDANWHQGVIGILASRLKDRLHRPVIAFADGDEGEVKGSARSIPGLHIRDVLDAIAARHPELLSKFGGHAMAAGLTLSREDLPAFDTAFREEVARHAADVDLQASLASDGELSMAELNMDTAALVRFAGPWGQHFPEPQFDGEFEVLNHRVLQDKHLKLVLQPAGSTEAIDAIAFNVDLEHWPGEQARRVRLVYRLDVNEYRGRRSLQLMVEQIECIDA